MARYRIEDITEADYGCEERPDTAPLLCRLELRKIGDPADSSQLIRHMPDELADELALTPGQIVTDEELDALEAGRKPAGWDDLDHRNTYFTDIGPVCMSAAEYRMYRERREGRLSCSIHF